MATSFTTNNALLRYIIENQPTSIDPAVIDKFFNIIALDDNFYGQVPFATSVVQAFYPGSQGKTADQIIEWFIKYAGNVHA